MPAQREAFSYGNSAPRRSYPLTRWLRHSSQTACTQRRLCDLRAPSDTDGPPVPDPHCVVHAPRYQLCLVELQCPDGASVSRKALHFRPRLEVPNLCGVVVRAGDEDKERRVGKAFTQLQAHYPIRVTLECAHGTSATPPGSFDCKTLAVNVFPWPSGKTGWRCVVR